MIVRRSCGGNMSRTEIITRDIEALVDVYQNNGLDRVLRSKLMGSTNTIKDFTNIINDFLLTKMVEDDLVFASISHNFSKKESREWKESLRLGMFNRFYGFVK
jgi:hypothetical protein